MSQNKLLIQLTKSLEDPEFDQLAILYLREVEGVENIFNCNSPYDSGLDIRNANTSDIEVQYQITTREKRFEVKLHEDLTKAKKNVDEHGLPKKVQYFYSYPLSNDQVFSFKKEAKDQYGLVLNLIEGKTIAGIAAQYDSIKSLIYDLSEIENYKGDSAYFDDPQVKSFYDLMSFGSSTDIKYNIVKSYVINFLYDQEESSTAEILKEVNKHFSAEFNADYFEGILRRLSTERKIFLNKADNEKIKLTESEKSRIKELIDTYSTEEALLKKALLHVLDKHDLGSSLDEIIIKLCELYESNYSINLGEFTSRRSNIHDLHTATTKFHDFLKSKLIDQSVSESIAKEIFSIADNNEILSRIAAGQVYSKVSNPDRLQEYITRHNNNKSIFLDTNLIINALCVHYESEANYDRYHFKVAKQFLNFANEHELDLVTLKSYAVETANIFKEALAILPFTKLAVFELLGGSKNILYDFYIHLKDWDQLHEGTESFEEFLKEFKFETKSGEPDYHYYPQVEFLMNSMGVDIELPPKYDLTKAKELIYKDLTANIKSKSNFAVNNDAIMLMRLGDEDVDVNPIDPIFCTWDMSLIRVRKLFFEEFPNCTEWLMFTPTRLMDHFSMMNLQIQNGTLSNEVLSILEEDFNFQQKTQSLLDSMLTIVNPKNGVGLQYTNKLAELRKSEIVQIDHKPDGVPDGSVDSNPVDLVFHKLFLNYISKEEEGIFDSLKAVFTKQELFDDVFALLEKEINLTSKTGFVADSLFSDMDKIIVESTKSSVK
ncbi:hypothetical protein [Reichenbachiella sp. MSK19-1]|uniref:hypothetical protein n=1 Tax=Reichenbachiella sp. MSK19-1 TaxID=1897631 RepID=UPI000E6CDAED|nr:hypothetical protein [Reichenbachiella sp. MSK19-1]RJE75220.1 hypothetical protein BGP76_19155 [Reichenbachiella sp. MSK19-1]